MENYRDFLTEHDLAVELGVSVWTLRSWRRGNYGPPAVKMGKRVLYRRTEVSDFIGSLGRPV